MRLTAGIFIAALGLASSANAAPAASPENPAPILSASANTIAPLISNTLDEKPCTCEVERFRKELSRYGDKNICQYILYPGISVSYSIMTNLALGSVSDVPATCGKLWQNLRRFPVCGVSYPACRPHPKYEDVLVWDLTVWVGCTIGMVQSAWWEATQNQFGAMECSRGAKPKDE
ncbi:hypothetical protein LY78DRAFT_692281, partial [Colletotrichum sublineola]|uniref:Uncharacterized protein n=1 Tax=Colletotrichum sublineola TaxID=1173701 RepID=A0A066XB08_COLSU